MNKLILAAFLLLLLACSDDETSNVPGIHSEANNKKYQGGLMKFWATIPVDIIDEDDVRWKTGAADIAERFIHRDRNLIDGDTVYLHWEQLPEPKVTLDTTKNDTGGVVSVDSTYEYFDTISVVVNDVESKGIPIEILNILPRVDSIWQGDRSLAFDSTIVLAAHPGEKIQFALATKDTFNLDFRPVFEWPEFGANFTKMMNDTLEMWSIVFPNVEVDSVFEFRVMDTGGYGIRTYLLHVISYREEGTAWVAAGRDLVKFSGSGSEVMRLKDQFRSISDLDIEPNRHEMFVLDRDANAVYYYDTEGRLLGADSSSFVDPLSVAIDVESHFLWVSDLESTDSVVSRVRKLDISDPTQFTETGTAFSIEGPVRGFSINQFERDLLWFVSPESDFIGYIINSRDTAVIFQDGFEFNRPSMISYDAESGLAWVADSSRVIVVDTSGTVHARITGFEFANSLSAGGGVCWVSDILAGQIIRFEQSLSGTVDKSTGLVYNNLVTPTSVSTFARDRSVWVTDQGTGQVHLIDASGNLVSSATGLKLPKLVRVHQVVE